MRWIETAITFVGVVITLMMVVLAKRRVAVDKRGSVSDRWIAEHRAD